MERIGRILWQAATLIVGVGMLIAATFPQSLSLIGIKLTQGEVVAGVRGFLITALWFIFGYNKTTRAVAEVEKSGPVALIVIGILVAIILEGSKLMKILQDAGFGTQDMLLTLVGTLAIVGGIVWVVNIFQRR